MNSLAAIGITLISIDTKQLLFTAIAVRGPYSPSLNFSVCIGFFLDIGRRTNRCIFIVFSVNALKIDRAFVNLIDSQRENCEIVKMIITLAHSLGMNAIAEGVEIPNQLMHLGNLGCEAAQGYFFAKPLNCQTAESIIAKKTTLVTVGG